MFPVNFVETIQKLNRACNCMVLLLTPASAAPKLLFFVTAPVGSTSDSWCLFTPLLNFALCWKGEIRKPTYPIRDHKNAV